MCRAPWSPHDDGNEADCIIRMIETDSVLPLPDVPSMSTPAVVEGAAVPTDVVPRCCNHRTSPPDYIVLPETAMHYSSQDVSWLCFSCNRVATRADIQQLFGPIPDAPVCFRHGPSAVICDFNVHPRRYQVACVCREQTFCAVIPSCTSVADLELIDPFYQSIAQGSRHGVFQSQSPSPSQIPPLYWYRDDVPMGGLDIDAVAHPMMEVEVLSVGSSSPAGADDPNVAASMFPDTYADTLPDDVETMSDIALLAEIANGHRQDDVVVLSSIVSAWIDRP